MLSFIHTARYNPFFLSEFQKTVVAMHVQTVVSVDNEDLDLSWGKEVLNKLLVNMLLVFYKSNKYKKKQIVYNLD